MGNKRRNTKIGLLILVACMLLITGLFTIIIPHQPVTVASVSVDLGRLDTYSTNSNDLLTSHKLILYADRLLEGDLVVQEYFADDVISYDPENIDWDMQASSSPNTFSLYLQALNPIAYLADAYFQTGESDYLELADQFVRSWDQYNSKSLEKNIYTWYDHSVAMRTENLIYYAVAQFSLQGSIDEKTVRLIEEHARWLSEDKNYTQNHNHGIFQDVALVRAGLFLDNDENVQTGLDRLDAQLVYAYPNKSVHIENSTAYHYGMIEFLQRVAEYLRKVDIAYANTVEEYYNGSVEYLTYAIKPNTLMPSIGDTFGNEKTAGASASKNFGDETLRYVVTRGQSGSRPDSNARFFKEDGYFFIREHWNEDDFEQSTWLMFKSGFLCTTHKHNDDLSIALYSKGYDIFIDPGMYNYMVGNRIHDYLNSTSAHNTIMVDGQSYALAKNLTDKAGMLLYEEKEGYSVISGFNNLYPNVYIDRSIISIDSNTFFIVDDIMAEDEHAYTQSFHLSEDIAVMEHDLTKTILGIGDTEYVLLLQQLAVPQSVDMISGENAGDDAIGVRSTGLNQVKDTTTLRYHISGGDARFVTLIRILHKDDLATAMEGNALLDGDTLTYEQTKIQIDSRDRLLHTALQVAVDGNVVTLSQPEVGGEGVSYCYYLLDKYTSEVLLKSDYALHSEQTFALDESRDYAVISYARNILGERIRYVAGYLSLSGGEMAWKPVDMKEAVPYVKSKTVEQTGENTYVFSLETVSATDITVSWYIYKDGAGYDYESGGTSFSYTFTEPGVYTCIYRASASYFYEIDHSNFAEIVISK